MTYKVYSDGHPHISPAVGDNLAEVFIQWVTNLSSRAPDAFRFLGPLSIGQDLETAFKTRSAESVIRDIQKKGTYGPIIIERITD